MSRPVPEFLADLADRLQAADDDLLGRLDLTTDLTADDLATVHASCVLGVLAGELRAFVLTGDRERLRELADHVSEWAGHAIGYVPVT